MRPAGSGDGAGGGDRAPRCEASALRQSRKLHHVVRQKDEHGPSNGQLCAPCSPVTCGRAHSEAPRVRPPVPDHAAPAAGPAPCGNKGRQQATSLPSITRTQWCVRSSGFSARSARAAAHSSGGSAAAVEGPTNSGPSTGIVSLWTVPAPTRARYETLIGEGPCPDYWGCGEAGARAWFGCGIKREWPSCSSVDRRVQCRAAPMTNVSSTGPFACSDRSSLASWVVPVTRMLSLPGAQAQERVLAGPKFTLWSRSVRAASKYLY